MARTEIRLPDDLHSELTARAAKNGRPLNGEMVERLQRSLDDHGEASRLGQAVAMVAQAAGETASTHAGGRPWTDDPWAYGQVCFAITELLSRLAPKGDMVRPEPSPTLIEGLVEGGSTPEQARRLAEGIIDRGPSIHTIDYLTSQGRGDFYAGARVFQARLGPKWASRLKRGESK
jgi:plasmid stability protein